MSKRRKIAGGSLAVGLLAVIVVWIGAASGQAADPMPADKMSVVGSKLETAAPGESVSLLGPTKMRTSSTEDLIFQVTAECALETDLTTMGNDDQHAFGEVRVWVLVDGKPVPVATGDKDGTIVFCNRAVRRQTSQFVDQNATIATFEKTRQANGFNWVALDVGNGIHTIEVKGDLTKDASSKAVAEAVIGNRTLVVQPTKAAHGETLGP